MKNSISTITKKVAATSAVAIALVCASSAFAQTTVIATDGFDDGNRTNVTDGINWYSATTATSPVMTVVDDTANLGSGNALHVKTGSTSDEIYGAFPSTVTIPAPLGSSISVKFDMRSDPGTGPVPGGTVRWGIYKYDRDPSVDGFGISDGDYDVGDITNDPSLGVGGDVGTWIQMNGYDGGFGVGGNVTRLRTENNSISVPGSNLVIFGGSDINTVAAPASYPFPELDLVKTSMEMIVTRVGNAGDDSDFEHRFNITTPSGSDFLEGRLPSSPTVPGTTTDSFDYLMIFQSGNAPFVIDNFEVSTTVGAIPEPSTLVLLSFAGLFCASNRRKK